MVFFSFISQNVRKYSSRWAVQHAAWGVTVASHQTGAAARQHALFLALQIITARHGPDTPCPCPPCLAPVTGCCSKHGGRAVHLSLLSAKKINGAIPGHAALWCEKRDPPDWE